jgi:medium-chain acyl-[acyl-carrier-protein] hydrolase
MIDVWTDNYTVRSYQSDRYSKLHLHSIAHFLQESAWLHAEACGVGYHDLLKSERLWILSGMKIKVFKYPSWGEKIVLNTWGNKYEGPFAYRDFDIRNTGNEVMIAASTSWLIIDHKNHHPQRITSEYQKVPQRGIGSGSGQPGKLPVLKDGTRAGNIIVKYSDIDIYQHVNNARIIEWCINSLPDYISENFIIEELEINYMSECYLGHEIVFYLQNSSNSLIRFTARNLNSDKEVFRADLSIRKKDLIRGE